MRVFLEYGIPILSVVMTLLSLHQAVVNRMLDGQKQIGLLMANDARFEEHLRHLDKDVESLKSHGHKL